MGGGGGGGTNTVTTTKSDPWEAAQPLARDVLGGAQGYYDWMTGDYLQTHPWGLTYQGERIAPLSQEQLSGFEALTNLAQSDIPYKSQKGTLDYMLDPERINELNLARQEMGIGNMSYLLPTLTGQYLNPESNQYLQQYANAAVQPIWEKFTNELVPSIHGTAELAGRSASGTEADLLNRALSTTQQNIGNTLAGMYSGEYGRERGLQSQAWDQLANTQNMWNQQMMSAIPQYNDLVDLYTRIQGNQIAVGEEKQKYQQAIDLAQQELQRSMLYDPIDFLSSILNMAYSGGSMGGTGTSTNTGTGYTPGLSSQLLGTGLGAASLVSMLGGLFK